MSVVCKSPPERHSVATIAASPHGRSPAIEDLGHVRVGFVAGVGLALGLALAVWTWTRAAAMSGDGAYYMELAERAWRLGPSAGMDWYSGPGYPVVVGWVYGLVGDLEFAGRATSFLFGVATLVGVSVLSRRMFGRTVAAVAVGLLAVHTTFVRHAAMAETDTAYGCWLIWSVWFTWELHRAGTFRSQAIWATFAGMSLGIGYLTRPEAVALAGLLGLWFVFSREQAGDERRKTTDNAQKKEHVPFLSSFVSRLSSRIDRIKYSPRLTCFAGRICWSILVMAIFVAVASPYLLKLRAELGRWSLSGKERAFAMKYAPDKRDTDAIENTGVLHALAQQPSNLVRWLPRHLHYGVPEFVKTLHPIVLVLAAVGLWRRGSVGRAAGAVGLLLWVSVPFLLFFGITYPRPRYFMQSMPIWTILAAVGTTQLAGWIARRRAGSQAQWNQLDQDPTWRRAYRIAIAAPVVLVAASAFCSLRQPIEQSLVTDRAIGERILEMAGPGRRVLSFSVTAFHARAERVPLWGPMQGIVRMHGYVKPLSYEDLLAFARSRRVEYFVVDRDILADCPDFLVRIRPEDFDLVIGEIVDHRGPHSVYRFVPQSPHAPHAN